MGSGLDLISGSHGFTQVGSGLKDEGASWWKIRWLDLAFVGIRRHDISFFQVLSLCIRWDDYWVLLWLGQKTRRVTKHSLSSFTAGTDLIADGSVFFHSETPRGIKWVIFASKTRRHVRFSWTLRCIFAKTKYCGFCPLISQSETHTVSHVMGCHIWSNVWLSESERHYSLSRNWRTCWSRLCGPIFFTHYYDTLQLSKLWTWPLYKYFFRLLKAK